MSRDFVARRECLESGIRWQGDFRRRSARERISTVTIQSGGELLAPRHSAAEPPPKRQETRFNAEVAEWLRQGAQRKSYLCGTSRQPWRSLR